MVSVSGKTKLLHRYLMEIHLRRKLKPNEVVHHKDGWYLNNDINNLQVFQSKAEHLKVHRQLPFYKDMKEWRRKNKLALKLIKQEKYTFKEIAEVVGNSAGVVSRIAKEHGYKSPVFLGY